MDCQMTELARSAATDCHESVERLIYHTTHRYIETHGGDFEDLVSLAQLEFMEVFIDYNKERGSSFPSYLRYRLWKLFQENTRKGLKRKQKTFSGYLPWSAVADVSRIFDLDRFLESMSEEAATVIKLILDPPESIAAIERDYPSERDRRWTTKASVVVFLRGLQWTTRQITESFTEIADALRGRVGCKCGSQLTSYWVYIEGIPACKVCSECHTEKVSERFFSVYQKRIKK